MATATRSTHANASRHRRKPTAPGASVNSVYAIATDGITPSAPLIRSNVDQFWLDNKDASPAGGGNLTTESEPNNSAATAVNLSTSWRNAAYRARRSSRSWRHWCCCSSG